MFWSGLTGTVFFSHHFCAIPTLRLMECRGYFDKGFLGHLWHIVMGSSSWGAVTYDVSVPRVVAWWHLKWRGNNPSKDSRCSAAFSHVNLDLSSLQGQVLNLAPSKPWMDCLDTDCCCCCRAHGPWRVLGLNPFLALQWGLRSLVPPQHRALSLS